MLCLYSHLIIGTENYQKNIFIPDLIFKYFDNEINSHSDINEFINSIEDIDINLIRNNLYKGENLNYLND